MIGIGPERIPVGEPGSRTLPSPVADEEVNRLKKIRQSSGRIVWAYYLGRAVTANTLLPFSNRGVAIEDHRKNVEALGDMVEEAKNNRLLRAGYNKGAIDELVARKIIFPPK